MNYYNINYQTKYNKHIKENPDLADVHYKNDLVNIFNIDEDSHIDMIQENITKLYQKILPYIETNEKFKNILLFSASKMMSNDLEMGFMLLHSFDTLWLIHKANIEYINNGNISDSILESIKENI